MLESVQAYAADALTHGARAEGAGVQAAARLMQPVELVQVPLFNPTASYSSYVVPAAFVLILHQTLLMGAAMLGGAAFERGGRAARRVRASAAAILGQGLAHWTIYVPAMLLYFVVMPRVYGFSTLGSVWALAALSIPVHPGDELPGTGAWPGVPPSRDRGAAGAGEQPAAVLPGGRLLARRGAAGIPAPGARAAAERQRDRRHGSHQPDGREPCGGASGLGAPVGAHACSISPSPQRWRSFARPGRRAMPRLSRRAVLLAAVSVLAIAALAVWYWRRGARARPRRSRAWCGRPKSASRPRSAAGWPVSWSNRADGAARPTGGGAEQPGALGRRRCGAGAGRQGAVGP